MSSPPKGKNVLILGATGPLGLRTVKEALSKDYKVTLYVRSPEKFPKEVVEDKNVTILEGALTDAPKVLFPHLPTFTIIISALGPVTKSRETYIGTPVADFYAALLQHLSSLPASQPRPYILALATPSQPDPNDSFTLLLFIVMFFFCRILKGQYKEIRTVASSFQKYGEGIPWTLYRVGYLTDGDKKGVAKAGYVGDGEWKFSTSRVEIARWLVEQMELEHGERRWVGKMPAVSGA